jgi:hypothetical protein
MFIGRRGNRRAEKSVRGMKQRRMHATGGKYIETRACLFASIPPHYKYIRNDVNHQPACGVKPLFTHAFFWRPARLVIEQ